MKSFKLKPNLDIYFAGMDLIGMWLKADYDKATTQSELLDLIHKWFTISETTNHDIKRAFYKSSAYYLYSHLTGESYDSKKILLDMENL